jgi:3-phenylpropionate/cinnamic acid dioxygenase small subunit
MTDETASLRDELAIRNLIARIALLADQGDLDEYTQQFTEDALWNFPNGPRKGRADIFAGAKERRATGTTGPGTRTRHVITNVAVQVAEGGTATADCYFVFLKSEDARAMVATVGTYHDSFVREGSTWRLARRDITLDNLPHVGDGPAGQKPL